MNKIVRFLILIAILSLSCNFMTGLFTEPALVEVTGPIVGMTVAASLDDQGQPVDVSFTYPVDQPEMVVVVRIGEVDPGPLTFSWYRVTEAGDEALFEQTVAVAARDTAFSSGLNPGILAVGTYKVVATFAGGSETITWDVVEAQPEDLTAPLDTSESAAGGTPAPGPSGTTPVVVREPRTGGVSGPRTWLYISEVNKSKWVDYEFSSGWYNAQGIEIPSPISFTVRLSAAIAGSAPKVLTEYTHAAALQLEALESSFAIPSYSLNPCDLPGKSDLPGTSIAFTVVLLSGRDNSSQTAVLGPDTSLPIVQLNPEPLQPLHEGKVQEGDKIKLIAIANEEDGGSWDSGISEVQIVKKPGDETLVSESNDRYQNKGCTPERLKRTTRKYTYVVPANPPPTITFCAKAKDFVGLEAEERCRTFHTGDQVKGTLKSTMRGTGHNSTSVTQVDADLSLDLEPGGTLSGTAQVNFVYNMEGTLDSGCPISEQIGPMQLTLPVTGEWTKDSIVFRYGTDAPLMAGNITTGCWQQLDEQQDVSIPFLVGADWYAAWDGQAYTADETYSSSGADWTDEHTYTIHLEPPAPAVGLSPGDWAVASADQASMLLVSP